MLKKTIISLATAFSLTFPLACEASPGDSITSYFSSVENRRINNQSTTKDKIVLRTLYRSMILAGYTQFPEASKVLNQCMRGDGEDVKISSRYFEKSEYVQARLAEKPDGTYGPYFFKQSEDVRLSYTFNGFYLDVKTLDSGERHVKIYQNIDFSHGKPLTNRGVNTRFYLGPLTFKMSDSLVFVASDCKPFTAYAEWVIE